MFLFQFFLSSSYLFASPVDFYRDNDWNIFPVPIVKYSPAEGPTYGLMPVVTASDNQRLKTIIAFAETYNDITDFSTFLAVYIYPNDYTIFTFFGELGQNFAREGLLRYRTSPIGKGALLFGIEFNYLQYPFERFYGFGPNTPKSNQTNFVSEQFLGDLFGGYRFTDTISMKMGFRIEDWTLHPRAIPRLADTKTFFAGNKEVVDSLALMKRVEFIYDTHENEFAHKGELLSFSTFTSFDELGSDFTFYGYQLRGKITNDSLGERFTTVVSTFLEQRFGDTIPFYFQSYLGGENYLRAFVKRRFTAHHRFSFDLEERIEVARYIFFDTETIFSIDPFFSFGQVFDQWGEIEKDAIQPVGGIGIRLKAQPAVVGRLDIAFGREGYEVYATLDYPF